VKTAVTISLPRPRNEATRLHPEYLRLFETLWDMIRLDAQRAISEPELREPS
jgi:hypothetical protein